MNRIIIRRALNGCGGKVTFCGLPVYHEWSRGDPIDIMGEQMNKQTWFEENSQNPSVVQMLVDWDLYLNGWVVARSENSHLLRYLSQIGSYGPPEALKYLK